MNDDDFFSFGEDYISVVKQRNADEKVKSKVKKKHLYIYICMFDSKEKKGREKKKNAMILGFFPSDVYLKWDKTE